ncbi:arginine:ornithine antiporter, APA family (TC 2.A.3.2.3) [Luteimonas cucumeris]|uniref:Arginine:ornithine antiporter, APA family (TC 2.A.3.2.3) n=1 Tax=Luteimonas cucumeris TaxID=985012 RepID=A0A562LFA7_9GAMM|nr:basic amino acid/polyamine antiporter [Luteimonas cucumeris]TWI06286.1 arginine:ornithine antiporter, APA family (TC 2.A.3.2.3) [Luteimonas cucumeris]
MSDNPSNTQKLPLGALTAMVVGGMVGAGVFSLPSNFGRVTGVYGAMIAWVIAGAGMLMLALVFQTLANRKPDLDAGVYAYARAGFGPYLGFFSAFGYWASACVGNVSYWILIKSTLGGVFPGFGEGNTLMAVLVSSIGIWAFHFMVLRGVKEAAAINKIVTIAKVIPLLVFLVLVIFAFKPDVFVDNLWGGEKGYDNLFEQVKATMLVTVFVFLGIEGASNYSRFAQKREHVGIATVTGFLGVLALFASVSILAYGILPRAELAALRQPSVGGVLESVVGRWGAIFIGGGLIISVLGAYLAWTLMAAEVLSVAAKKKDMPAFIARENAKQVPSTALLMTSLLIQLVLVATLFSADAFTFALSLCSHLSLFPYFFAAAFALKLVLRRETYDSNPGDLGKDRIIAILAVVYTLFLLFAGGVKFMVLGFLIYAPGTLLYYMTRREQGKPLFTPAEWVVFAIAVLGAVYAVYGLATGQISI